MTQEEKTEKQNQVKIWWESQNKASWIFNEETCSFDPPVPYPDDGNVYVWDEDTITWILS
jgi:outer membrane lipoprotein-sorting protein